jgi:16S rRNA (guanine527-N7)-methyltransferase
MPGVTSSSTPPDRPDLAALAEVFEAARRAGFLGPGPAAEQIAHAGGFAAALEAVGVGPATFLDLGSGAGLPGLVLAALWPAHSATLLDGSQRRTAFLRRTVVSLGWGSRVVVAEGRAESLARDPELRAAFPLVVSRSFATPSVTAEIGGAFLEVGGALAVSEPAEDGSERGGAGHRRPGARWPNGGLADLGLAPAETCLGEGARVALIRRSRPVNERWPRGVAIPAKRPLW